MIKQESDKAQMANGSAEAVSGPEKVGRRVGLVCYYLFLVFVLSAGSFSILRQVYGHVSVRAASSSSENRCAGELESLEQEILVQAGGMPGDVTTESRPPWLVEWDRRLGALEKSCGRLEPARADLTSLRVSYQSALRGFLRQQAHLVERIERELDN